MVDTMMDRRAVLRYISLFSGAVTLSGRGQVPGAPAPGQSSVCFNQVGYRPNGEKIASVQVEDAADRSFQIISEANGTPVFSGRLLASSADVASGNRIALADFTAVTDPGMYRFVTPDLKSKPFVVRDDVYLAPLALSMRAFYGQRCGCDVDLGDGYSYHKCHPISAFHASSGHAGPAAINGGWHDAGDYGRYIVSSAITTGTLLWAWELYSPALRNLNLHIPESGGKLPDYLAEVRWNLEWMLSLQDEDGGVWHKQTSEQFCGVLMPQDDHSTSYVIGTGSEPYKGTCATAGLAAAMAIAARCYSPFEADFSARCLNAARRAWKWAVAHPNVSFANPSGIGSGAYDDAKCNDEVLWASAELWRTTGDHSYELAFVEGSKSLPLESAIAAPSWVNVAPLAYWTYLLSERPVAGSMRARIHAQTATAAKALLARHHASGYGTTLDVKDYIWGSNSIAANQSLLLLIAHQLEPDAALKEAALGNLHYVLGRNCFGVSWVTHVGTTPFQHPHHRPSMADDVSSPWPGLLSGGPNAKPSDPIGKDLRGLPPMRVWIDDEKAYSLNEVAINWNAPLVFLLAAANS
jgi:endoglucanase